MTSIFNKKIISTFIIFLLLTTILPNSHIKAEEETNSYIIEFTNPSLISTLITNEHSSNKTQLFQTSLLKQMKNNLLDHKSAIQKISEQCNINIYSTTISHYHFLFNGIRITNISKTIAHKIETLPFVKQVQKDILITTQKTTRYDDSSSKMTKQYHVSSTYLNSYSGNNISIAFFDTGIDYYHPALQSAYKGGYDFVNQDEDPFDDNGHGTHVIGITAATPTKISNTLNFSGIAPNASVFAYKVLDEQGEGYTSYFLSAFEYAMDPNQDGNISDHIDIISISAGNPDGTEDDALSIAADRAVQAGICVVAAAGNNGPKENTIHSPAIHANVIAVGATINDEMLAAYSSRGSNTYSSIKPDVLAPGHEILSTWPNNQYYSLSGTSMATPYVTGLIACILEKNNSILPSEIKSILHTQTKQLGYGLYEEGYGLINPPESFEIKQVIPIQINAIQEKKSNMLNIYLNVNKTISTINYTISLSSIHSLQSVMYQTTDAITLQKNNTISLDLNSIPSGLYVLTINLFNQQSYAHHKHIVFFDHEEENNTSFPSVVSANETFFVQLDTKGIYIFIVPLRSIQMSIGKNVSFKAPELLFSQKNYVNAVIISLPLTFPISIEKHLIKIYQNETD